MTDPRTDPGVDPSEAIEVRDYREGDAAAFERLNLDWIEQWFEVEPKDREVLGQPERFILKPGGAIFMAVDRAGVAVGAVAMIAMDTTDSSFELAKMGVAEAARGRGVGQRLAEAVIERARDRGADRVYIESSTKLEPAIRLYRKLGFVEIEGGASPYARCDIQMELRLRP